MTQGEIDQNEICARSFRHVWHSHVRPIRLALEEVVRRFAMPASTPPSEPFARSKPESDPRRNVLVAVAALGLVMKTVVPVTGSECAWFGDGAHTQCAVLHYRPSSTSQPRILLETQFRSAPTPASSHVRVEFEYEYRPYPVRFRSLPDRRPDKVGRVLYQQRA